MALMCSRCSRINRAALRVRVLSVSMHSTLERTCNSKYFCLHQYAQFAHLPFVREPRCSAVEPMLVACCDYVSPSHSTHCYAASTVQFSGVLAFSRRLCGLLPRIFTAYRDEYSQIFRAEYAKIDSKESVQSIPHMAQVIAKCVVLHSFSAS